MPPVAVREGMDEYEAMMKADGDFDRLIGLVLDPKSRVIQKAMDLNADPIRLDADIAVCEPIFSCPSPHVLEHPPMKLTDEIVCEEVAPPASRPGGASSDVLGLGAIQVSAGRHPCGAKTVSLFGLEWRGVAWLTEGIGHRSSQSSVSRMFSRM